MTKKAITHPKSNLTSHQTKIFILKFSRLAADTRKFKRISQKELAEKIDVTQSVIANFEANKNMNPKIDLICRIAGALGIYLELRPHLKKSALAISLAKILKLSDTLSENFSETVASTPSATGATSART